VPEAAHSQHAAPRDPPFSVGDPARLVVCISGGGRTLLNLADAIAQGRLPARISGVIASTPQGSEGVRVAAGLGAPVVSLPGHPTADEFERAVSSFGGADVIVLAGYLKRLEIPATFAGRIVNIHPALLPAFGGRGMYGRRVHEAVLASGASVTGCTVHLVDAEYDHGPVLLQRSCPVLPGDTPETLAARVFELEKAVYVEALGALLGGVGAGCGRGGLECDR